MKKYSTYKNKLIKEFENSELQTGEYITLTKEKIESSYEFHKNESYEIVSINGDNIKISETRTLHPRSFNIKRNDIAKRNINKIGANPFTEFKSNIRNFNFSLESIIRNFNLAEEDDKRSYNINGVQSQQLNWNPFVFIDDEKYYYQRDFVWSFKQKQNLIESFYKDIFCGTILIRKRSWRELESLVELGETEIFFNDIIDGKQRLNAVSGFINDRFKDLHGNYFSDLSNYAQNKFLNSQLLSYSELPEETSDKEVLYQFQKMNFEGIPQSTEHLKYVESLFNKMQ